LNSNKLIFSDNVKLNESFMGIKGHFKMTDFDTGKTIVDKDNHIVITGRSWLMQKMFGMPLTQDSETYKWTPAWFSVGSGGCAMDSPFIPIWPTDTDEDLFEPEPFGNTEGGQYCSSNNNFKLVDSISFPSNLSAKMTMTLDYKDLTDKYINEAGMFIGEVAEYSNTKFIMFSHVTFPTYYKSIYQKISIEWFFKF
jgi:hypothetical protein